MTDAFEGWAVLELMGHRRLAGKLTEATIGGGSFIRIDVPSDPPVTQYYAPGAVYAITPTTEDIARRFATRNAPMPVSPFELPAPKSTPVVEVDDAGLGECEGCDAPAVTTDSADVPLCQACYDNLLEDADAGHDVDGERDYDPDEDRSPDSNHPNDGDLP